MIKRNKNLITYIALTALTVSAIGNINPMVASASKGDDVKRIQILGTTDVEAKFGNSDGSSNSDTECGYNQISQVVKDKRAENPNTLLLDNGNCIGESFSDSYTDDAFLNITINPFAFASNYIGYDCMVLGNNEFNFELNALDTAIDQIEGRKTSVLCANVYWGSDRVYKPYTIKEVDGVRVAIIGITTNNKLDASGCNAQGYKFARADEEVRTIIDELKYEGAADVFVVSANVGSESSSLEGNSCKDIANLCPEVSVILAGGVYAGIEKEIINGVLIAGPKGDASGLVDIDLEIKLGSDGAEVLDRDSSLITFTKDSPVDEELNIELEKYYDTEKNNSLINIGKLEGSNLCQKDEVLGIPESFVSPQGVTDLINSVQLYNCQKQLESMNINLKKAHIVSACSMFSLDANLMVGNITNLNLSNLYKYDDKLCTVKITGKELKRYLEWSAEFYNTFNKGDLTISFNKDFSFYQYDMFGGLSYDINISKEAGKRIENLCFADGKKVKNKDVVYLAVNDYRYFEYLTSFFGEKEQELICESTDFEITNIRDMIADYITNVKGGCLDLNVDCNWKLTGVTYDEKLRDKIIWLINNGCINIDIEGDLIIDSITYEDVIAQLKKLGCDDAIKELEKIKDGDYSSIDVELKVPVKNQCGNKNDSANKNESGNKNDSSNKNECGNKNDSSNKNESGTKDESSNKTESTNKDESSNKTESQDKNDAENKTDVEDKTEAESKDDSANNEESDDKIIADNVDSSNDNDSSDNNNTSGGTNSNSTSTKTGDSAKVAGFAVGALLAAAGAFFALKKKKEDGSSEENDTEEVAKEETNEVAPEEMVTAEIVTEDITPEEVAEEEMIIEEVDNEAVIEVTEMEEKEK